MSSLQDEHNVGLAEQLGCYDDDGNWLGEPSMTSFAPLRVCSCGHSYGSHGWPGCRHEGCFAQGCPCSGYRTVCDGCGNDKDSDGYCGVCGKVAA